MRRPCGFTALAALLSLSAFVFAADDPATLEEVRALRSLVERQSQQIQALTEEVAKLNRSAGIRSAGAPTPAAIPAPASAAPAGEEGGAPGKAEFSPDVPRADAADGKRHVVVKGETFTSIAKHYTIPLAELQKANKEVDPRKLQIGQTLSIPESKSAAGAAPAAASPAPAATAPVPAE